MRINSYICRKFVNSLAKTYVKEVHPELSTVNNQTGEEISSGITETIVSNVDEFMMFFLNGLKVYNGTLDSCTVVLFCCWKYSTPNTGMGNLITNDAVFKEQIRLEGFKMSDGTVNNCITQLVNKELLIRKNRGRYMLNPKYFFKGKITERTRLVHKLIYEPINNNENA